MRTTEARLFRDLWNWFCQTEIRRWVALLLLCNILFTLIGARVQQGKMADAEARGREAGIAAEVARAEEAAALAAKAPLADGTTWEQVQIEAEYCAKVVVGTAKNNSRAGQKMTVWGIIFRYLNPNYPNSIEGVCRQDQQWMGYNDDNPVLQEYHDLALEELVYFHNGGYYPAAPDFVFLEWTPDSITLFTRFDRGGDCEYFRESDWTAFELARATVQNNLPGEGAA